jgi:FlaA1/EpsC-like NDP-sugar epimerase
MVVRNRYFLLADIFFVAVAAISAFVIRFDTFQVWPHLAQAWFLIPLAIIIRPPLFYLFGLYRRMWNYASVNEVLSIVGAVLAGSVIMAVLIWGFGLPLGIVTGFPRSVLIIEGMLSLLLLGGTRFALRIMAGQKTSEKGAALRRMPQAQKRVLVVGAGDAGAMIVREMRANPGLGLMPVGFIDDDVVKQGMRIHNVPVLGTRDDISGLVAQHAIEEVIIAMPTAPGRVLREFRAICEGVGVRYKTIPGIYELLDGSVSVGQIRDVQLEDLLRREPIAIDLEEVGRFLAGARVLVTGAGGSIGQELCRQIARYDPQRLILLDKGETSIFYIHRELVARFPYLHIAPLVCDIRDKKKIEQIMGRYTPTVVFHSAANKHVPLMEVNVDEAVTNNVIGTQNLIEASQKHGVKRFVLISTDKAVNPRSVMGASKRVAEMLIQEMARRNGRAFVAVRFGNVLGSSGSVIPIFKAQIAAGGPITVTHPEARRYFMTIPEAVQLVIQTAAMGKGGEIFVLDMGEQIRILDLAMDLIALSGLEPGQDIDIVYTELRPGEKLCEELFREGERVGITKHEHIFIAEADDFDGEALREGVLELERLTREMDGEGVKRKLKELVPEYQLAGRTIHGQ